MNLLRAIGCRLRSLIQRMGVKQAIDEELRFHLDQRTAENIAAGMTSAAAAREARKRFGNLQGVREECRATRGACFGETTLKDVRFGLRMLWKNPGFTVIAIFTLALGIGASSSVFSLIQGVLLTPPNYPRPEQVVLIEPARIDGQPCPPFIAGAQWAAWRAAAKSFDAIAGYQWARDFLVLPDASESVEGLWVTSDYFKVIGVQPALGRAFLPSELSPDTDPVILLSHGLWQKQFDADPKIIGKVIHLSGRLLTVVGVMPRGVRFLPSNADEYPNYDVNAQVDYWLPDTHLLNDPKLRCSVVARLARKTTLAQAQAELTALAARQAQMDTDVRGLTAKAELLTASLNREARRLLQPLAAAVLLVFLIACGNVAGLLLARGFQRQREYVVRSALGAGRWQLFRQALTESLVLALLGGGLGAGLAAATVKTLQAVAGSAIPRLDAVTLGWPMLAFCFGAAALAAVMAGLIPAFRASQLDAVDAVKSGGPNSSASRTDRRLLAGVAVVQTALTLALLVGAGLLVRTVNNLARIRPGYDTQNILSMSLTQVRHAQNIEGMDDEGNWARRWVDFHRRALVRVAALPGVKSAAFAWGVPLTGNKWLGSVKMDGRSNPGNLRDEIAVPMRAVSPEYFATVGLPMLDGRNFHPTDVFNWPPPSTNLAYVAIINQAMAEQYFPKANPLGKTFHFSCENVQATAEIVGVAANSRSGALTEKTGPEIYFSYWQLPAGTKHLVVRTAADPRSFIAGVQRELRAMDPTVVIEDVRTFQQIRDDSISGRLFAMRLLVGFSMAASALALVGIYGVLALSVGSRRREIAIRMAVGAQRWQVLGLLLGEGLKLITVGLLAGTGVAFALARLLRAFLFGIEPTDPVTFAGVAILFAVAAVLACYFPARRASRTDPMSALRHE